MSCDTVHPAVESLPRLLEPGAAYVPVYADASYADSIGTGSWVFTVPTFGTLRSGIEPGSSVHRLELSAVVHGIRFVTRADLTDRPIAVHTDSDVVIRILEWVRLDAAMPNKPFYHALQDLYSEARQLAQSRVFTVTRRVIGDSHHSRCDRAARETLREHCAGATWNHDLLYKRAQNRRKHLMTKLATLHRQVDEVEKKLVNQELEISLLRTRKLHDQPIGLES